MIDLKELRQWVGALPPNSEVAVDDGGLMLIATTPDDQYVAHLEVGGLADGVFSDDLLNTRPDTVVSSDDWRMSHLLHVDYDGEDGLVDLDTDTLLVAFRKSNCASFDRRVPRVVIPHDVAVRLFGELHSWHDIIPMLAQCYDTKNQRMASWDLVLATYNHGGQHA